MEALKPKKTLVEEAYDTLVNAICSGEIRPGERLNQDEIAEQLGVSRQPVNNAISILKSNGLVEDTGRRSVVVSRSDPDLYRSIYEYRKVIEPFAIRLAGASLGDNHRRQADRILRIGYKSRQGGQLTELLHADMLFHQMIYEWSGNLVVQMSMKTNWHHIHRSMAEVLRKPSIAMPVWEEHSDIIETLFSGQTELAAQIMEDHIDHAYRTIFDAII